MSLAGVKWFGLVLVGVGLVATVAILAGPTLSSPERREEEAWAAPLRDVDHALAEHNVSRAEIAWHTAYTAALESRGWEGMIAVGDAYLRIGEVANGRQPAEARSRELYLAALSRAHRQGSLGGMLRTAEAVAALGDAPAVEQALASATVLAAAIPGPSELARVQTYRERLGQQVSNVQATRTGQVFRAQSPRQAQGANISDPFPLLFPDEIAGP